MWLHFLTSYSVISFAIMEIAMKDKIGSQEYSLQRASFYISGLVLGPIVALYGIGLGIRGLWDSGGK